MRYLRIAGIAVALIAVALCARALNSQWHLVRSAVERANAGLLVVAFLSSAAAMAGLGFLWWRCLRLFGETARLRDASAWYFAGELGKYVPGGVWSVLGRGELAQRGGQIRRATGYATTIISYVAMCVGAAIVSAVLAPAFALDNGNTVWPWLMLALIPIGIALAHPAVFGRILAVAGRRSGGRLTLQPAPWSRMLVLVGCAIPTWVLVGTSSVLVAEALGFHQDPARVAFAAVAAWIIGFLAIPVPAGAGLREIVFVELCGLASGRGVAVAAGARLLLIAVDGLGGVVGLLWARRGIARHRDSGGEASSSGSRRGSRVANAPG